MTVLEISVIPIGSKSTSFHKAISDSYITSSGQNLKCKTTPTSTILEGSLDDLLNVVKEMHSAPFNEGIDRVITSIKIDQNK